MKTSDGLLYTGITTDVSRRWSEHQAMSLGGKRGAKFFRGRLPKSLEYVKSYSDRSTASKQEYCVKSLSPMEKKSLIQSKENQLKYTLNSAQLLDKGALC